MKFGRSWGRLDMQYKLSELMDVIGGGTPKTSKPEYWNGDIPWLSVKDFNNDCRYVYQTEKRITKDGLENSSTKLLDKGDMIISARGTVGEIASIPYPMAFNQSCYGLRAKSDLVTSDFLYYLIKYNVAILKNKTHGSVFDTITRDTFDGIEVDIPDLNEQKNIASLLSDLDAKIELNVKINEKMPKVYTTRSVIKANNKKTIEFPENYFSVSPVISVEAEVSGAPIYVEMNSTTKNSTVIVNSAAADLYFHLIAILA